MERKKFDVYTFGEAKTGGGQLINFSCHPDDVAKIKIALSDFRSIDIPTTKRVVLQHGSFGSYTRYDIKQHKYAGGGGGGCCGYIEVLEIKDPPDNRCGIVIHEYDNHNGSRFTEFQALEDALSAFEKYWRNPRESKEKMRKCKGFIRRVECGIFQPWFYAVGDQLLQKDFVFPDIIEEDAVFRFGRKFILRDIDGLPALKTCVSTHITEEQSDTYSHKKYKTRIVYWDDGTKSSFTNDEDLPRPLDEKELWIQEAIDKFKQLLSGGLVKFAIDFIDGSKFIGTWRPKDKKSHHAEGKYKVSLVYKTPKGTEKKIENGEFYFKPTPEIHTIEQSILSQAKDKNCELIRIESIIRMKGKPYSGMWEGVFVRSKED
jgi:hypothetical protein